MFPSRGLVVSFNTAISFSLSSLSFQVFSIIIIVTFSILISDVVRRVVIVDLSTCLNGILDLVYHHIVRLVLGDVDLEEASV